MTKSHPFSRRQFIAKTTAASLLTRFGLLNSFAQSALPAPTDDYKALVCIFLTGGNDGHNMLIPQSGTQFTNYKSIRGSLALPDPNASLLPITNATDGLPYALNSGLSSLQPYWAQGQLAMVANMGMLVTPTSQYDYQHGKVTVPDSLFSHSDQMQQMQSGVPSSAGGTGWGGRVADGVQSMNGTSTFPTTCSIAGPALFCNGKVVQSCALLPGFNLDADGMQLWPVNAGTSRMQGLQQVLQFNSGLSLIQAANEARQDAIALNAMLTGGSASLATQFPGTSLGTQLQQVASIIKLRSSTGMKRQVFFCALGGFDTHGGQSWQQYDLFQQLSDALVAFYKATTEDLQIPNQITSFTLSDFGRTLQPSGSGTDHGWGNHHILFGGAVQGGKIYGTFPQLVLGGPDDSGVRGAMIPTTSIDQFGATLAAWMGVPTAAIPQVFTNLPNFTTQNLGFFG